MTQTIGIPIVRGGSKGNQIEVDLPTLDVNEEVPVDCGIMRIINAKG